jgi:seryl-tRNA synthetase
MAKRKAEDSIGPKAKKTRTRGPGRKTAKVKGKETLMARKKELKRKYKEVQKDLKHVDKDLKSLGYSIRSK